jgi:hypothetical protein
MFYNSAINKWKGMTLMLKFQKGQYIPKSGEITINKEIKPELKRNRVYYCLYYREMKVNERLSVMVENILNSTLYCSCGNITKQKDVCPVCNKNGEITLFLPTAKKVVETNIHGFYMMNAEYPVFDYNKHGHLKFTLQKVKLSMNVKNGSILMNDEKIKYGGKKPSSRFISYLEGLYYDDPINRYELPTRFFMFDDMVNNWQSLVNKQHPREKLEKMFGKRTKLKAFYFQTKTETAFDHIPEEILEKFLNQSFQIRKLKYRRANKYLKNYHLLHSATVLLENPNLQDLPFHYLEKVPENLKEIVKNKNGKELYDTLFHHPSTKVRALIHEEEYLANIQMLLGNYVKDPNNQVKLLSHDENSHIISNQDNKLFGLFNKNDAELFDKGMKYLLGINENETVFTNRFVSSFKLVDHSLIKYIGDMGVMAKNIAEHVSEYKPRNTNNFRELHDELSRVSRRYSKGNRKIKHSVLEKSFEKTDGKYEWYLPKETFELVECGEELGICVGDYGDRAVNKDCTILFLKVDGKIEVCMELQMTHLVWENRYAKYEPQGYSYSIVQAKADRNQKPYKYNDLIIEFLKEKGIKIHTKDVSEKTKEEQKLMITLERAFADVPGGHQTLQDLINEGLFVRR